MANERALQCPMCGRGQVVPQGSHGRCPECGYRGSCRG